MNAAAQRTSLATLARAVFAMGVACTLMLAAVTARGAECFPDPVERMEQPLGLVAH